MSEGLGIVEQWVGETQDVVRIRKEWMVKVTVHRAWLVLERFRLVYY